ncbi:MAG TPA: type II secretion system F family protein [Candidatus Gracilibacteria bacterium]
MAGSTFEEISKPKRDVIYGVTDRRGAHWLVRMNDFFIDQTKITQKEKNLLFHSLELLVGSGVRFTRAISMISKRVKNIRLARVLNTINYDMEKNGMSFSAAMDKYPDIFSRTESRMIKAGELTGKIEETLESVSEQIQKNIMLDMQIRKALMYPISVVVALIIAIIVVMLVIMPKFTEFFGEFDAALPLPTQILVNLSYATIHYWWLMIIIGFGVVSIFKNWRKSDEGKRVWDRLLLNLPNLKTLVGNIQTFRITTQFSVLLESGIPVAKALKTLAEIIPNSVISDAIYRIERKVTEGVKMSQAFLDEELLDPVLGEVVEVGEQTGRISVGLKKMSYQYQLEVESQLRTLTALIEPFTIVLVALCVGFIAFAILLPIFKIQELITTF